MRTAHPCHALALALALTLALASPLASRAQSSSVESIPSGVTYSDLGGLGLEARDSPLALVDVVLVDLFDASQDGASALRGANGNGTVVVCSFSGGALEAWRPDVQADLATWEAAAVGAVAGAAGEFWLDTTQLSTLQALIGPRLQLAKDAGCDAVDVTHVDCFAHRDDCYTQIPSLVGQSGKFGKAMAAQTAYGEWQAQQAHALGLAIGLRNAPELTSALEPLFDFAVSEGCLQSATGGCEQLRPFADSGKAVLHVELTAAPPTELLCAAANAWLSTKFCNDTCVAGAPWANCWPTVLGSLSPSASPSPRPSAAPSAAPSPPPTRAAKPPLAVAKAAWTWDVAGERDSSGTPLVLLPADASAEAAAALLAEGHTLLCSFSAGKRPASGKIDGAPVPDEALLGAVDGEGSAWVDVGPARRAVVQHAMRLAIVRLAAKGCGAVVLEDLDCAADADCAAALVASLEPEPNAEAEVEADGEGGVRRARRLQTDTEVAAELVLEYALWLASVATRNGLASAPMDAPALAAEPRAAAAFDFAVALSCVAKDSNCSSYASFVAAGKPVLNAEVVDADAAGAPDACATALGAAPKGVVTKVCAGDDHGENGENGGDGDDAGGLCAEGAEWVNCFAPVAVVDGGTGDGDNGNNGDNGDNGGDGDDGDDNAGEVVLIVLAGLVALCLLAFALVAGWRHCNPPPEPEFDDKFKYFGWTPKKDPGEEEEKPHAPAGPTPMVSDHRLDLTLT